VEIEPTNVYRNDIKPKPNCKPKEVPKVPNTPRTFPYLADNSQAVPYIEAVPLTNMYRPRNVIITVDNPDITVFLTNLLDRIIKHVPMCEAESNFVLNLRTIITMVDC